MVNYVACKIVRSSSYQTCRFVNVDIAVPRLEMNTRESMASYDIWILGNLTGNVACSY